MISTVREKDPYNYNNMNDYYSSLENENDAVFIGLTICLMLYPSFEELYLKLFWQGFLIICVREIFTRVRNMSGISLWRCSLEQPSIASPRKRVVQSSIHSHWKEQTSKKRTCQHVKRVRMQLPNTFEVIFFNPPTSPLILTTFTAYELMKIISHHFIKLFFFLCFLLFVNILDKNAWLLIAPNEIHKL